MKTALRLCWLALLLCGVVAAQKVPTCNGFDANGVAIDTVTNSSNCTDYFGAANWANSPLPAGTLTGFTLINAGGGYVNPVVVIGDEQHPHTSTPISLSLATSSAAFASFTPALRPGGSTVFSTFRRGLGSTA